MGQPGSFAAGAARDDGALRRSGSPPIQPPREIVGTLYTTFLASTFRSIRFGSTAAHGRGIAIQLNHFLDAGAVRVLPDGTFTVDEAKMDEAVTALTREIVTLQAEGSYEKAQAPIERLGVVRPPIQRVLDKLAALPVDIEPRFTMADALTKR